MKVHALMDMGFPRMDTRFLTGRRISRADMDMEISGPSASITAKSTATPRVSQPDRPGFSSLDTFGLRAVGVDARESRN